MWSPFVVAGCVSAPGACGFCGDLGDGFVVVAEHSGNDWCGCLEDELADRGGAGVGQVEAEFAQAIGDGGRVDGLAGSSAGELSYSILKRPCPGCERIRCTVPSTRSAGKYP